MNVIVNKREYMPLILRVENRNVQVLAIRNDLFSPSYFSLMKKTKASLEHLVQLPFGDNSFKTKGLRESFLVGQPLGRDE